MQRREAALARGAGRPAQRLQETDYLLVVHDKQRSGALRFKERVIGDHWLSDKTTMAAPPWTSLRESEHASWNLQADSSCDDPHYLEWLNLLIAPGSSIGGARPKAEVRGRSNANTKCVVQYGEKTTIFEIARGESRLLSASDF